MKPATAKIYLSGIGILSLAFFFWLFLYQMFVNTEADTHSIKMYFEQSAVTATKGETISLNVYLQTPADQQVSNAKITLQYPSNMLRFVSTLNDSNFNPDNNTDVQCMSSNPLSREVNVSDDSESGRITVTRAALDTGNPPAGIVCFGTLRFEVKEDTSMNMGMISFGDTFGTPASGPQGNYVVVPSGKNSMRVNIDK